jgi:hypothetical protein
MLYIDRVGRIFIFIFERRTFILFLRKLTFYENILKLPVSIAAVISVKKLFSKIHLKIFCQTGQSGAQCCTKFTRRSWQKTVLV